MADDINKKIIIDVELADDGQQQISQYKAAFDSLRSAINGLSNPLANLSGNIGKLGNDVSKLKDSLGKLDSQNKSVSNSSSKLKSSLGELKESTDVVKNAFDLLKEGATKLEGALTGGLAIILTYGPEIMEWVTSLFKGKEAIDQVKMSTDDMNQAVQGTDYSDAIEQVNRLKENIELAKDGFLNKKKVLQDYNDTLGQTMGQVSNLDAAETKIKEKAGAYIQMTLLKATANLALQDAAKKAQQAEQAKRESDDDALTFWDKTVDWLKRIAAAGADTGDVSAALDEADTERHIKAMQRRKEATEDLDKQSKTQLDIYADLEKQIAKIARDNGFNLDAGPTGTNSNLQELAQKKAEALSATEKMTKDSLTRQMQSTYEAYGKEASQFNTHYQDELNKLKGYLDQKLISQQKYNEASEQLTNEYHGNLTALMNKYNDQDKDKTIQAQNELVELRINGMKAGDEKEKAELLQQQAEKLQEMDKADAEIARRKKALESEMKTASPEELPELKKLLDNEETAWWLSYAKRLEIKKQTAAAIKAIDDKAADDAAKKKNSKQLKDDQESVDSANNPNEKLAAEKKLVTDKYEFEKEQAKGNAIAIKEINVDMNRELAKLDKNYQKQKAEQDKKAREELKKEIQKEEKEVADAAFSILNNEIKQSSQAKIAALEKDKAAELSNTSLTSGQKQVIEQKYQKQEAQAKTRAFKQEQEASIAQAIINGALAITKVEAQAGELSPFTIPIIIAETAVQVAKIAAQKPPAYASGGLHYMSDGRGGVLPGYSKTDNTNAYLRSGEGVVVSEAMRVPWARNLVSAINVGFGGRDFSMANPGRGYAVGGIFTDGGDANRYYNQPVHDQKNLANTIAYQMINNFPPVYVDVKDINNQQNILAQTINRVNL